MKKIFLCVTILCCGARPFNGFAQSEGLIDLIKKIIPANYGEIIFADNSDFASNFIVLVGVDTTSSYSSKIFILKKENNKWKIVDTSGICKEEEPHVAIDSGKIIVSIGFHHGANELTFEFNKDFQKYQLVKIENWWNNAYYPDQNHLVSWEQTYMAYNHTLVVNTDLSKYSNSDTDEIIQSKQKILVRKSKLIFLSNLNDPQDDFGFLLSPDNPSEKKLYDYLGTYSLK